ncbi:hypothetical protein MJD09_06495, partial [bacterium]|nr:hypothetical protein [bacterium]
RKAAQRGVDRFLFCDMKEEKIQELIFEAIRRGGLRKFLQACCPGSLGATPYVAKMVDELVHAFPRRMKVVEMAKLLAITPCWLQSICRQAFDRTFIRLVRLIWVHQALCMMRIRAWIIWKFPSNSTIAKRAAWLAIFAKSWATTPGKRASVQSNILLRNYSSNSLSSLLNFHLALSVREFKFASDLVWKVPIWFCANEAICLILGETDKRFRPFQKNHLLSPWSHNDRSLTFAGET